MKKILKNLMFLTMFMVILSCGAKNEKAKTGEQVNVSEQTSSDNEKEWEGNDLEQFREYVGNFHFIRVVGNKYENPTGLAPWVYLAQPEQ